MFKAFARTLQIVIDLFVLSVAVWLAFAIRFDWQIPPAMLRKALLSWPLLVAVQYSSLAALGATRISWRYVSLRDALRILSSTALASAAFLVLRFVAAATKDRLPVADYALVPVGANAIDFVLAFLAISGVRVVRRVLSEQAEVAVTRRHHKGRAPAATLLVGAGQGGVMVAKELAARRDLGIRPVAFIDDDPLKVGTQILGIPVVGKTSELPQVAQAFGATQALITVSNAPGSSIRAIADRCRAAGLEVKVVPGLYEIVGGRINLSRIRNVAIDDLLRRELVQLDTGAIAEIVRGRVAMVTGAGGSIGSELCRQLVRFSPGALVLVEKSENALFEIHRELAALDGAFRIIPCVADIGDEPRMRALVAEHRPHVVLHAAAHKHVPMMERDSGEAVKNNVFGTKTVADLAHEFHASAFVMISTDKAVNPTSVMGATKRIAEIYTQALSTRSATRFVTVRFGNVLGSNGSVIPIFKEQIANGGPVTVTHPDMHRYFMTIPEACQLVLQAGTMGKGGEIFVLDMGEPVKIVALARDLIRLSGFHDDEIEIVFTGTRPGEKLFEELSLADEHAEKTHHPKVYIGRTTAWRFEDVERALQRLLPLVNTSEPHIVRRALQGVVREYAPTDSVPPPAQEPDQTEPAEATPAAGRLSIVAS
jgi:FlaA1/EpsC-like NDP-sugar epimerase